MHVVPVVVENAWIGRFGITRNRDTRRSRGTTSRIDNDLDTSEKELVGVGEICYT